MKMKERLLSVMLCATMVLGLLPQTSFAEGTDGDVANAPAPAAANSYLDLSWNETENRMETSVETIPGDAVEITADYLTANNMQLNPGTYYVAGEIVTGGRISVQGEVHLILKDGCLLDASVNGDSGGIYMLEDSSLTIYAQSQGEGMGRLIARGYEEQPGIGGSSCAITINGGDIVAGGGFRAAGIGSVSQGTAVCTVTINGGKIKANGGNYAAGIGESRNGPGSTITINGGDIVANGGFRAAGIGSDNQGKAEGTAIAIRGGIVKATGGEEGGAGIGSGYQATAVCSVTITGGTVTATGRQGAGIGNGMYASGTEFSTGPDGNAFIVTPSISGADDAARQKWGGVIFEGDLPGKVFGNSVTLNADAAIPEGKKLYVESGQTLAVQQGVTLYNNGVIYCAPDASIPDNIVGGGTIKNSTYLYGELMIATEGRHGTDFSYENGVLTVLTTEKLQISTDGLEADNKIVVACANADITLKDAKLVPDGISLVIETGASAALTLLGENVLSPKAKTERKTGDEAIQINTGASLTIDGEGSLAVTGGRGGNDDSQGNNRAANGGAAIVNNGGLTIMSGVVQITGGEGGSGGRTPDLSYGRTGGVGGAGISGSGPFLIAGGQVSVTGGNAGSAGRGDMTGSEGTVGGIGLLQPAEITGGVVTIQGGRGSNSSKSDKIGGPGGSAVDAALKITGGLVKVTGGEGGSGKDAPVSGADFTLPLDGLGREAVLFTGQLSEGQLANDWEGVLFEGTEGRVYGRSSLKESFEIPSGYTLEIPSGKTMTIEEGTTLTNRGDITGEGALINEGIFRNYGTVAPTIQYDDGGDEGGAGGEGGGQTSTSSLIAFAFTDLQGNPLPVDDNNIPYAAYGDMIKITATMTADSASVPKAKTRAAALNTVEFTGKRAGGNAFSLGTAQAVQNGAAIEYTASIEITLDGSWDRGDVVYDVTADFGGAGILLDSTATAQFKMNKAEPLTDAILWVSEITATTITTGLILGSGQRPSKFGCAIGANVPPTSVTNWSSSSVWSYLQPATVYTLYLKYESNSLYKEAFSPPTMVCTTPNVQIDYQNETFSSMTAAMEYSVDGGSTWNGCAENMALTAAGWDGTAEKTVQIRVKAANGVAASPIQTLTIPPRPATGTVTVNDNGVLDIGSQGANSLEYSLDSGVTWNTAASYGWVWDLELTGSETELWFRQKAISTAFSGTIVKLDLNSKSLEGTYHITGGALGTDYRYLGGLLVILTETPLEIANADSAAAETPVRIADGVKANLTLAGVNISVPEGSVNSAIEMETAGDSVITLREGTENTLSGGRFGVHTPADGKTLTIGGAGTLTVSGQKSIGGQGGIVLREGRITAPSGISTTGSITIESGLVKADGEGIQGGTFSTGDKGGAFIFTSKMVVGGDPGNWDCVIFVGTEGSSYGEVAVSMPDDWNVEIPQGYTLTIETDTELILEDITLRNNGVIIVKGYLTINNWNELCGGTIVLDRGGRVLNHGTIRDSAITVEGSLSSDGIILDSTITITVDGTLFMFGGNIRDSTITVEGSLKNIYGMIYDSAIIVEGELNNESNIMGGTVDKAAGAVIENSGKMPPYIETQPTTDNPQITLSEPDALVQCQWQQLGYREKDLGDSLYPWQQMQGDIFQSTNHEDNSSSTLRLTYEVDDTGILEYSYKVSSESGCDKLKISIYNSEGELAAPEIEVSDELWDWVPVTLTDLKPGTYTIEAVYSKDGSVSDYEDCAWIQVPGTWWEDIPGAVGLALSPLGAQMAKQVRGMVTYDDKEGNSGTVASRPFNAPQTVVLTYDYQGADGGNQEQTKVVFQDEPVGALPAPTRTGYTFTGWFAGSERVTAASTFDADAVLTASWGLNSPTINGDAAYSAAYDGNSHTLGAEASHALSQSYPITYAVYKDDNPTPISTGRTFSVKDVADSGTYKIVAAITDGSQTQTAQWTITVSIEKAVVTEPAIAGKVYTGSHQTADIQNTPRYTVVENAGGTAKGSYDVVLELTDSANYKWSTVDTARKTLSFVIYQGVNRWTTTPNITGWTYGSSNNPVGASQFGSVVFTYYDSEKGLLDEKPTDAGSYYMVASVEGDGDNYAPIATDYIGFTISKVRLTPSIQLAADSKVYDGSTDVTGAGVILTGAVAAGEQPTATAAAYAYNSANVAEADKITATGIALDGDWGKNYELTADTAEIAAAITKADQTTPGEGEGYAIDYTAETIAVTEGYEVFTAQIDGEAVESGAFVIPGATLFIRKAEAANYFASDWAEITVADRPSVPQGLTFNDETILGKADGVIAGITPEMEYKIGGGPWKAGDGGDVTGLGGNITVLVRIAAVSDAPHGEELTVTIAAGTGLTVTFDSQEGSAVAPITDIPFDTAVQAPAAPSRNGYAFVGWYTDAACSADAAYDFSTPVQADVTLYAKWIEVEYTVTQGADQEVSKGGDAVFAYDAGPEKFVKIQVDGVDVDASHYTVESGKVMLKADYISTLSVGEHTLTIFCTDGYASTVFTVKNPTASTDPTTPPTGDHNGLGLWLALIALSAFGTLSALVLRRRRGKN